MPLPTITAFTALPEAMLLFRALLVDAQLARDAFPEDAEISLICEVLQLAQGALSYAASTLGGQLVALLSSQVRRPVPSIVPRCAKSRP